MAKALFRQTKLNNNFGKFEEGKDSNTKYEVIRIGQYTKTFGKETKERNFKFQIKGEDKTVSFGEKIMKAFVKNKVTAEEVFENAVKEHRGKIKISLESQWNILKKIVAVVALIMVVMVGVVYVMMTTDKNFNDEIVTLEDITDGSEGDFIAVDMFMMDANYVEITETNETYGVETSSNTKEGNTYVLGTFLTGESNDTFIYRFNPQSKMADKFNINFSILGTTAEEYEIEGVEGEIKKLSEIEDLDGSFQFMDYFNESIDLYNEDGYEFNSPKYLIDGNVTQGKFSNVIMGTGVTAFIALATIALTIVAFKKDASSISDLVSSTKGRSPIQKA
ncbi:MAG: hypothetical protein Q9M91_07060 [Candidatus Dojkabacteria bacterium]|nr:hypothetical protein [Candidatus Dojkabacteria bacterium]MDQ7021551.1 hypothetical protein [Candidatus Dojkabacteria bacterium]